MKQKILSYLREAIAPFFKEMEENLKEVIQEEIKNKKLPVGQDFLTGEKIYRENGYCVWMGKMFANEENFRKYRQLIESPDEAYKIIKGEPLKMFKGIR